MNELPLPLLGGWPLQQDGSAVLRPAKPQDALQAQAFVHRLSARTQRRRFHGRLPALGAATLTSPDALKNPRHSAWVGVKSSADGREHLVADARYVCDGDGDGREAEFAIVVEDSLQGQGLGSALLLALRQHAADNGVRWLRGQVQIDNTAMVRLLLSQGFQPVLTNESAGQVVFERRLRAGGA